MTKAMSVKTLNKVAFAVLNTSIYTKLDTSNLFFLKKIFCPLECSENQLIVPGQITGQKKSGSNWLRSETRAIVSVAVGIEIGT